jgi:hypothetical protein
MDNIYNLHSLAPPTEHQGARRVPLTSNQDLHETEYSKQANADVLQKVSLTPSSAQTHPRDYFNQLVKVK